MDLARERWPWFWARVREASQSLGLVPRKGRNWEEGLLAPVLEGSHRAHREVSLGSHCHPAQHASPSPLCPLSFCSSSASTPPGFLDCPHPSSEAGRPQLPLFCTDRPNRHSALRGRGQALFSHHAPLTPKSALGFSGGTPRAPSQVQTAVRNKTQGRFLDCWSLPQGHGKPG